MTSTTHMRDNGDLAAGNVDHRKHGRMTVMAFIAIAVLSGILLLGQFGNTSTDLIAAGTDEPSQTPATSTQGAAPQPAQTSVAPERPASSMTVADLPGTSWTPIEMTGFESGEGLDEQGYAWVFYARYLSAPIGKVGAGHYVEYEERGMRLVSKPADLTQLAETLNYMELPFGPREIGEILADRSVDISFPTDQSMLMRSSDKTVLWQLVGSVTSADDLDGSTWTVENVIVEFANGQILVDGFDPIPYTSNVSFVHAPGSPVGERGWPFKFDIIPVTPIVGASAIDDPSTDCIEPLVIGFGASYGCGPAELIPPSR